MFTDFEKVLARTPVFPFEFLFKDGESRDLEVVFRELLNNNVFTESIYWSSVQLYAALQTLKNETIINEKKTQKLKLSLQKYIIRSCTRPTPFGTFAGVSTQTIDKEQEISTQNKKHVRLDVKVLKKLINAIEKHEQMSDYVKYRLNNTIYSVGNEFRFLEVQSNEENKIQTSSLEKSYVLEKILTDFLDKDFDFEMLYNLFKNDFEKGEFKTFFQELIETRFLVSEFELSPTTENDLAPLIKFLKREKVNVQPAGQKFQFLIQNIILTIEKLEGQALGQFTEEDILPLCELFASTGVSLVDFQIFHVDLLLNKQNSISIHKTDIQNVLKAVRALGLLIKTPEENSELKKFKALFLEKFESRSIRLSEALDIDLGIGFPPNENLGLNSHSFQNYSNPYNNNQANNNFSDWLWDAIEDLEDRQEINISEQEISSLDEADFDNYSSAYIIAQALSDGKILLENFFIGNPNSILARFAYMDYGISNLCREISEHEKKVYTDCITADIIWIPDSKTGNICRRISNVDYEIPIFYNSSKPQNYQIPIRDVLVSINAGEIILFSKKLKKRIIPHLSNAHNFQNSSNAFYRFLCALQYQKKRSFALNIDINSTKRRFFPRVSYKNIVLFPRHWIMQETDLKKILNGSDPILGIKEFFRKWSAPTYVMLIHADNELLIDTSNESYLVILLNEVKKHNYAVFKEWLYDPTKPDSYVVQHIIPLKNNLNAFSLNNRKSVQKNKRKFIPGEDWVYLKIYCGSSFSDEILQIVYNRIFKKLMKQNEILQFFFIRYTDPHFHIRIRFQIVSPEILAEIVKIFKDKLKFYFAEEIIWKMSIDTYEREIERYSANNYSKSEHIFFRDSENFLAILNVFDLENAQERFFLAIQNVDSWLSWARFDISEKMDFCLKMTEIFSKEHPQSFIDEIKTRYRDEKEKIYELLDKKTVIKYVSKDFIFEKSLLHNLSDYIHMSINRWFYSDQRRWEYAIYYFCSKYYTRCYFQRS